MIVPDFTEAALKILHMAYEQYMTDATKPIGLSVNDYPQGAVTWQDMKRETIDLDYRGLITIVGMTPTSVATHTTLILTPYGRQYCEGTLGFRATKP
jgi:hypothetical protein